MSKVLDFLPDDEEENRSRRNDGRHGSDERHEPLTFVDIGAWAEREPPTRECAGPERSPLRHVSLLSGEASAGSSIHMLARDWALTLPDPGAFLYIDAEDDKHELERLLYA